MNYANCAPDPREEADRMQIRKEDFQELYASILDVRGTIAYTGENIQENTTEHTVENLRGCEFLLENILMLLDEVKKFSEN